MPVVLIYLLEALGVVPLVLILHEFFRDLAAGPNMGYVAGLAYGHIGLGFLAAGVATLAGLADWKTTLLAAHAPALTAAGVLLCFWALIGWLNGTGLGVAGGLLAGGVASFVVGNLLTPEALLRDEQPTPADGRSGE